MAAESATDGGSAASTSSNGYPSDLPPHAASNGTTGDVTVQIQATNGGAQTIRSVREQQLIARGRHLLQTYQQKTRERREIMDEMCFSSSPESELSAVEILGDFTHMSHLKNGFENGINSNGSTAMVIATANAVSSGDSDRNWLAASSNGSVASNGFQGDDFELEKLQSANEQLLESIDTQLETLQSVVGEEIAQSDSIQPLWSSLSQLIQQKRKTEAKIAAKVLTGISSSAKSSVESGAQSDFERVHALQSELSEAKSLISELKASVNEYESKLATFTTHSVMSTSENGSLDVNGHPQSTDSATSTLRKLQNRILEKDELLMSLRTSLEHVVQDHGKLDQELRNAQAVIERLQGEKAQMEKAAADKRTLLHRAYVVKAKQLDLLCKDVELPSCWERVTDENGIIYYRQNDRACAPELDDPRVGLALQRISISSPLAGPSSSPRSAAGRMEQTYQSAAHHRTSDRKYSSSSFDSTVSCEDIAIPPEDGTKHEVDDFETPLPDGWEMRVTTAGAVFFVNRDTNVTTWKDPRKRKSRTAKRASAPADPLTSTQRLRITIPERRSSNGDVPLESTATSKHEDEKQNDSTLRRFDVVFEEKGPIGIHFQANMPDAGATVRRLLPRMAAARTEQLVAYDRLVAVNKNPVDSAPFRYVMLLLQGGLRPLTLTFERDLTRRQSHQSHEQDHDHREMAVAMSHDGHRQSDHHLDEEVVLDESGPTHRQTNGDGEYGYDGSRSNSSGSNDDAGDESSRLLGRDGHERRVSSGSAAATTEVRDDEFTIADKIITNLFSLFWTPPEQLHSQVETV